MGKFVSNVLDVFRRPIYLTQNRLLRGTGLSKFESARGCVEAFDDQDEVQLSLKGAVGLVPHRALAAVLAGTVIVSGIAERFEAPPPDCGLRLPCAFRFDPPQQYLPDEHEPSRPNVPLSTLSSMVASPDATISVASTFYRHLSLPR